MINEEKESLRNNEAFGRKVLKSAIHTFLMVLISIYGIYLAISFVFSNMSAEQSNTWIIISFCIGIIFTIFYCTYTIIEEIKK